MEFFTLLRKHFALCGIASAKKSSKIHPLNAKNAIVFILNCVYVTSTIAALNEANSFDERMDIYFQYFSASGCGIIYEVIVSKTPKLFEFINNLAETVNKSE